MTMNEVILELEAYQVELRGIEARFSRGRDGGPTIHKYDFPRYREIALELQDLFEDEEGLQSKNRKKVCEAFEEGENSFLEQPSLRNIQSITTTVTVALKRLRRKPKPIDHIPEKKAAKGEGDEVKPGREVFVVHGHAHGEKETLARFLEQLDLDPIILHERASEGRTIIEKLERYSQVGFAIVLLTPDDEGRKKGEDGPSRPRARQNVILELGYFMGRLGRNRVVALVRGEIEHPSDVDGVVYIKMDEAGAWQKEVTRELRATGLEVDLNKLLS